MTKQERIELIRQSEDCKTMVLAGKEREFFFGRETFVVAEKQGVDLGALLEGVSEDDHPAENLGKMAKIAWLGCLVLDESADLEEFELLLSIQDGHRLKSVLEVEGEAPPTMRPGPPEGK